MLVFSPGWNEGTNNNAARAMNETDLGAAIQSAITRLKLRTTDDEMLYLGKCVESNSPMLKAKVVKGMHQDTGNQILPEVHCTVESTDFPPKRFHIWFLWIKRGSEGWQSSKVSYETAPKVYKSVDIL
jgi:hypothetical protein